MEARPTPLEIIKNMRNKNFREEIILEEVEKELIRLQPLSPQSSVGAEEILYKHYCEYAKKRGEKIEPFNEFINQFEEDVIKTIYAAMTEYSQLISGSKDSYIEKLKQDIYDLYEEQHQLQSLLESKEKECEELKKDLTSYKDSFENNQEQFMELAATAKAFEIDLEYWKQRCEAAELNISTYSDWHRETLTIDGIHENAEKEFVAWEEAFKAWQALKSKENKD